MRPTRKVTMELPEDRVRDALEVTGESLTETVRRGLKLVAAGKAYRDLRQLRAKVKLSINVDRLRRDGR